MNLLFHHFHNLFYYLRNKQYNSNKECHIGDTIDFLDIMFGHIFRELWSAL